MLRPDGNAICAQSDQKGDADEECKACCDDNEGSLLLDLVEVELGVNVQACIHVIVSPITSKHVTLGDHFV